LSEQSIDVNQLIKKAIQVRRDILETLFEARSGHPGGSLSSVEILLTLYYYQLRHRSDNPGWDGRDRLIISKGHISPAVYVTLAHAGYFPMSELKTFRKFNSRLQGHVHTKVPGVEFNTGSLGHGLSVANGMALGARLLKKDTKIYCLLGDGEIQEGSVWEAAMTSAHYKIGNICAIVDYNKVQENGPTNEIKNLEPLAQKWKSFGWAVKEVDGHSFVELVKAFDGWKTVKDQPYVILAHTIKGKGVSFMEGDRNWHGKAPGEEELARALEELE